MAKSRTMGRPVEVADLQEDLFAASVASSTKTEATPFSETERTKPSTKSKKKAEAATPAASVVSSAQAARAALAPHKIGIWIAASAAEGRPVAADPAVEPYPCRCDDDVTDAEFARLPQARRDAYRKEGIRPKRCNPWRARGVPEDAPGAWRSKCPCWGRQRDDRLPDGCCSNMDVNPAYGPRWSPMAAGVSVVSRTGGTGAALDDPGGTGEGEPLDGTGGPSTSSLSDFGGGDGIEGLPNALRASERVTEGTLTSPMTDPDARWFDALGLPLEIEPEPIRTSWSALDVTCECRTPWGDGRTDTEHRAAKGRRTGYHCQGCCRNFKSYGVADLHQRDWTVRCLNPATIADVGTGRPLMRLSVDAESGLSVWGLSYAENDA